MSKGIQIVHKNAALPVYIRFVSWRHDKMLKEFKRYNVETYFQKSGA